MWNLAEIAFLQPRAAFAAPLVLDFAKRCIRDLPGGVAPETLATLPTSDHDKRYWSIVYRFAMRGHLLEVFEMLKKFPRWRRWQAVQTRNTAEAFSAVALRDRARLTSADDRLLAALEVLLFCLSRKLVSCRRSSFSSIRHTPVTDPLTPAHLPSGPPVYAHTVASERFVSLSVFIG